MYRHGFSTRGLLVALALATALPAASYVILPKLSRSTSDSGPMMYCVERGDFIHEITERGNVESSKNVEIRCEVKAKGSSGTTILEIVPEGSMVKEGDILARLDSSALEINRTNQSIICSNSKAVLIQAKKDYETAVIAKKEYLEGQYQQAEQTILNEKFMAQEDLSKAKEYVNYSEQLAARGYIPQQQLEADHFAVDKAANALNMAETKLKVLQKFTRKKMEVQLESDIKTAEARMKAQEASHELDKAHLEEIENQIAKCVIRAPQDGQVVYANETNWRGSKQVIIDAGEMVRERQAIIRMPDSKQMNVVAKINEANVALVSPGMPATVRLDAFPELELQGTVQKVGEFPVPTSWFGSSVKEYETTVQIDETPPGLRPGLTAEVRILVEHVPEAIQAPVQSVFEHGEKYYCVSVEDGRYLAREVKLGSTNDKTVIVDGGLSEGESIVLNGAAYRDKVDLPDLPTQAEQVAARAARHLPQPAAEVVEAAPAVGAQSPTPNDLAKAAKQLFTKFDKDGDGKLRLEDLPKNIRSLFQAATTDDNSEIDRVKWTKVAVHVLQKNQGLSIKGTE